MSHERTGEMLTLRQKYSMPFTKFQYYRSEDGVPQWRHLSRPDRTRPNPFKEDETVDDLYKLGDPMLYYIVDDDQVTGAQDDNGHRLLREQVSAWEYVPVKLTEHGMTAQKPSKINDDMCDSLKGVFALFGPRAAPLTQTEKFIRDMPSHLAASDHVTTKMAQILYLQKRMEEDKKNDDSLEFR